MHYLLVPFGSHGDVHPFLGLGLALEGRGHRVTFLVSEYYGPLVRGLGFEMIPTGEAAAFEEGLKDPELWHPRRALSVVGRSVVEHARVAVPIIEGIRRSGEVVAVGGSMAFAVRLARERSGVPAATVHLSPSIMHSDHDTPAYPGLETPRWWPLWFRKIFFNMVFARAVDPQIAPGLNALRGEMGLPPVRDVLRRWSHSPDLVLGFFPPWFAPPQPDWPANTRLVGFPLFDERGVTPLPAGLAGFLDAGPAPIAFTPGSANMHGRAFFEAAADACARLGRRGLLLTRHRDQVPPNLPEDVRHVDYAPFGLLLPRVAALAHHGGIGTSAQAMAAGVPQLVMPLSHDQFDNAARMRRLGVARSLLPAKFRGPRVAEALGGLIDSAETTARCRAVAARFSGGPDPMEAACEALEDLAERSAPPGDRPRPRAAGRLDSGS